MSSDVLRLSPRNAHALWADNYDRESNPLLALEERVVEPLLPRMKGMRVLDVACGTGRWLERLSGRDATLAFGLDVSSEMLRQASRKPRLAGKLLQASSLAMPLPSAAVDFAICSFALSYTTDLGGSAKELSRVVKNHGHVIVSDLHPAAQARGWKRRFRHNGIVIEVSSRQYPLDQIRASFAAEAFELVTELEPQFSDTERPVFEQRGKGRLFHEVLGNAAIYVCHFRRDEDRASH